MVSFNYTFHMFALPMVKISILIIELASYKGKDENYFFSDFDEHVTPLFSKEKIFEFYGFYPNGNLYF